MLAVALTWRGDVGAQRPGADIVFGPRVYVRTAGGPNQYDDRFTFSGAPQRSFTLHIVNGDERGGHRVSSATISLGDTTIATPRDFSKQIKTLDRTVVLTASNTLHVRLTGEPGSHLTISILASTHRDDDHDGRLVVDAGPDMTVVLPASAALNGSVALRGGPDRNDRDHDDRDHDGRDDDRRDG